MIDYKDFVIPEFYWDYFVREKRGLFISSYLKDNNILPSEDMIKNFIIEEKEKEDFKRMLYSKYCISGVMPEIPNVPEIPDGDVIIPNNPNSGNSGDNIVIPESSGNIVNVMFDIDMNDIPEIVGVGNNVVNTIFKQGILNGDLLDKSIVDITLINENHTFYINNINKVYNIPKGKYIVKGVIGNKTSEQSNKKCYLSFNQNIDFIDDSTYVLIGNFESNLILSNSYFRYEYDHENIYINTENCIIYQYNEFYYTFVNNWYKSGDIIVRRIIFEDVVYNINNNLTNNGYYHYNVEKVNEDYIEWFTMIYNIVSTNDSTKLFDSGSTNSIKSMKIDGQESDIVSAYTFDSLGKHEVKVFLKDISKVKTFSLEGTRQLMEIVIPSTITDIKPNMTGFLSNCGKIEKIYCYAKIPPKITDYICGVTTFSAINKNGILYVPKNSDYSEWFKNGNSGTDKHNLSNYNWTIEYME